jgi:hypothetical protein
MVTLHVSPDGPLRALGEVPRRFKDPRAAIEALKEAVALHYGAAGRAFMERLVQERANDEAGLRTRLAKYLRVFKRQSGAGGLKGAEARASKLFAVAYAAGRLAREWDILPTKWGRAADVVVPVYDAWRGVPGREHASAAAARQLWKALKPMEADWVPVDAVVRPLAPAAFNKCPGFIEGKGSNRVLLVPVGKLRACLANSHAGIMRQLCDAGVVQGENGKIKRPWQKASRKLAADRNTARVYRIRIGALKALCKG